MNMIALYIFAIIGVIASVAMLLAVVGAAVMKKPELPQDLFEDCRADLRQLQDWYFSQRQYEQTEKTTQMLKELDELWAEHDMNNATKDETAIRNSQVEGTSPTLD